MQLKQGSSGIMDNIQKEIRNQHTMTTVSTELQNNELDKKSFHGLNNAKNQ